MSDSCPRPCCGHRVLEDALPGAYEICPVCFREEDGGPSRRPTRDGGANKVSSEDWAAENRSSWPADRSVLRWWLPTFWRCDHE
ncbi:CPCC family cysteine-rich protein [Streptomyces sp. NPDC007070]|uniref:CPCC family cysteine-rich protein n=1 Tax=Streptomyces sp. NPDC007070 TaxID=3154312 RepID=UPI0033CE49A5